MPHHTVHVTYTEPLVKFAADRYWRSSIGSTGFVMVVLILGMFALLHDGFSLSTIHFPLYVDYAFIRTQVASK